MLRHREFQPSDQPLVLDRERAAERVQLLGEAWRRCDALTVAGGVEQRDGRLRKDVDAHDEQGEEKRRDSASAHGGPTAAWARSASRTSPAL
jgi:hypothetical protein